MVTPSLNTYGIDKERVVFLSSWFFVIGSLLLLAYFLYINTRFVLAFAKAATAPSKKQAVNAAGSTSSSDAPSGNYQVKIKLHKVGMTDSGSQFHYDWKVVENRSGSGMTSDQREALDRKVQCFCRNHASDIGTPTGEHDLVQWF